MTDHEFDALLSSLKPFFMRLVRGIMLAFLVLLLGFSQSLINFPVFVLAGAVFVFGVSTYAARFAYLITFFLTILLIVGSGGWATILQVMGRLWEKLF